MTTVRAANRIYLPAAAHAPASWRRSSVRANPYTQLYRSVQNWNAVLLIFVMVFTIPSLQGTPIPFSNTLFRYAPVFPLAASFVVLALPDLWRYLPTILKLPALRWLLGLYAVIFLGDTLRGDAGLRFNDFILYLPILPLIAYMMSSPRRIILIVNSLLTAIVISHVWYALELTGRDFFINWRQVLYGNLYVQQGWGEGLADTLRTGLTPFLHLLGYQSCAGVVLLLTLALTSLRKKYSERNRARSVTIVAWPCLILVGTMLLISGQRSAVAATLCGVAIILWWHQRNYHSSGALVAIIFIIAMIGLLAQFDWQRQVGLLSLSDKLQSSAGWGDFRFRMLLQVQAVKLLILHPFGLAASGLDWEKVGFWPVYQNFQGPMLTQGDEPLAVHNGYLAQCINYGILFASGVVMFLWQFLKLIRRLLADRNLPEIIPVYVSVGMPAAAIGLFLPQTALHNAGILTREPICILSVTVLCALEHLRRQILKQRYAG